MLMLLLSERVWCSFIPDSMMTHFSMLQRNLLHTGVTRAKTGLILVGQKKAVGYCVRNVTVDKRNTLLAERLSGKI